MKSLRSRRPGGRPQGGSLRAIGMLSVAALLGSACGVTTPLYLDSGYETPTPEPGAVRVVVATPVDARGFSSASNRAPVPSVQGDPADPALTARVVGRRPTATGMLGSNVLLPPDQSVSQWVGRAVVEGLRQAGIAAVAEGAAGAPADPSVPRLEVSIHDFWLNVQPSPGLATVVYRVDLAILGPLTGFREGARIPAQNGVSAGGLDMTLWQRSFDRALADIASGVAAAADPLGRNAPQ